MANQFRIEVSGANLDDQCRARLTQALKERIATSPEISGKIEVRDATRAPMPGERSVGAVIIGEFFLKHAGDVALKELDETIIRPWLNSLYERVIVKIKSDEGDETTLSTESRAGDQPPPTRRKYAILIANQTYENNSGIESLKFCENDVDRILEVLLKFPDEYSDDSIVVLKNKMHWEIENSLNRMLRRAKDDFLLIYYSGHGKPHPTTNKFYITARNTEIDTLTVTAIEYEKIVNLIRETFAKRVGIILDCCYSGLAKEGMRGATQDYMYAVNRVADQQGRSFAVITASRETETAGEQFGSGVLTNVIARGIETGEADTQKEGFVTFSKLHEYIKKQMPSDVYQTPDFAQVGSDAIVLVRTGLKKPFKEELQEVLSKLNSMSIVRRISETTYWRARTYLDYLSYFDEARDDERYKTIFDFVTTENASAIGITKIFETQTISSDSELKPKESKSNFKPEKDKRAESNKNRVDEPDHADSLDIFVKRLKFALRGAFLASIFFPSLFFFLIIIRRGGPHNDDTILVSYAASVIGANVISGLLARRIGEKTRSLGKALGTWCICFAIIIWLPIVIILSVIYDSLVDSYRIGFYSASAGEAMVVCLGFGVGLLAFKFLGQKRRVGTASR